MRPSTRHLSTGFAAAIVAALATITLSPALEAQQTDWDAVEITTTPIAPGVYMLEGRGGNLGVSVGEDGVFLIDDQFAPLTEKILGAIGAITDEPVRFVFNTHWHGDHTGGNENLGEAGAVIVAHRNVLERLSMDQVLERIGRPVSTTAAAPRAAWPVVTFTSDVSFHLNGDEMHAVHVANAHTDGDAIVHFREANVLHMGDTFFVGRFPFIDTASGGSINGLVAAVEKALSLSDGETRIIPGHGPLSDRDDLMEYGEALQGMRGAVAEHVAAGHSVEETLEARPIQRWAEAWGQSEAAEESFVRTLHASLSGS